MDAKPGDGMNTKGDKEKGLEPGDLTIGSHNTGNQYHVEKKDQA